MLLYSLIHLIGQLQSKISHDFSPDGTSSVSLRLLPSPQEKALGMCRTARTKKAFHVLGRRLGCVRGRSLKSFLVLGRRPRARGCRPAYTTRRQECFCLCCPSRFLCYVSVIFMLPLLFMKNQRGFPQNAIEKKLSSTDAVESCKFLSRR